MLEILFEDEYLIAIDKPAGVVVHPTYRNMTGTLLDDLRAREPSVALSVVGRLDRLTSGIVVVAKSAGVHAALQKSWPDAEKDYLAVVQGRVALERGDIDLPLGTDPADRRRRLVRPDGAPSLTRYERLAYIDVGSTGRSVLRCRLVTGRRHQIRVHLASRGWPVVGDAVYGEALAGFPRHALHAWTLRLRHPADGRAVSLQAPVPEEIVSLYPNSDTVGR